MMGIVIVGHGSRIAQSKEIYEEIAKKVKEKSGIEAQVGYMKHWRPTITEAINAAIEKEIKKIVIVPLFLLPGMHVTEDIPVLLSRIKIPKGVEILYARNIGADDRLADIVLDRVEEVLNILWVKTEEKQDLGMSEHSFSRNESMSGIHALAPSERMHSFCGCEKLASEVLRIEEQSFRMIESKLKDIPLPEREVVKRVVHATADFGFAELLVFKNSAIERGIEAIRAGKKIITDVEMVKAGINSKALKKHGGEVKCFIGNKEVHTSAENSGKTRASSAFRLFKKELHGSIVAIGNAPTALFELCNLIDEGIKPSLVVAVPVGFVGAKKAKEKILRCDVPSIVVRGNKGGSTVAAAIVNALVKLADKHA